MIYLKKIIKNKIKNLYVINQSGEDKLKELTGVQAEILKKERRYTNGSEGAGLGLRQHINGRRPEDNGVTIDEYKVAVG